MRAGRSEEAARICRAVLEVVPDHIHATMALVTIRCEQGNYPAALEHVDTAVSIEPGNPNLHTWRGAVLDAMDRSDEALRAFGKAVDLARNVPVPQPFVVNARLGLAVTQLRVAYRDEADLEAHRAEYERALDAASSHYASASREECAAAIKELTFRTAFLLPHQGKNDKALQAKFGDLMCHLMRSALPSRSVARSMPPVAAGERIRVGFVLSYAGRASVWKLLVEGWVRQLDRSKFEIFAYNIDGTNDERTRDGSSACDHFESAPLPVDGWANRISKDDLHVLVYPELGTHLNVHRLAALRLAPVQCATWGHPETSGLATIDHFLSSELMESESGQEFYTENLVRLPNLSFYYEPSEHAHAAPTRASFGLRDDALLFWGGQAPSKHLPQHDAVFARIAKRVPNSQFVFVDSTRSPSSLAIFRGRMKKAFEAEGLSFEAHCVILPTLTHADFMGAMALMDVALDSIGWSGANSTMELLSCDVPIVTMPGESLRSRHTHAILTRMGMPETIASTHDEFVAIAARLATDAEWRSATKAKVARLKSTCFRDRAPIAALEAFFERCARPAAND